MTRKVVNNNLEKGGENHLALLNHVKEYRSELGINQTELGKLAPSGWKMLCMTSSRSLASSPHAEAPMLLK